MVTRTAPPLALMAMCVGAPACLAQITLQASRSEIPSGDSVMLSWSVPSAARVFLSGVGLVPATGQFLVAPDASTTYVLAAEGPEGAQTAGVRVLVLNARGSDEFPDSEEYGFQFAYQAQAPSWPEFLDRVHDVLQNRLRHPVRSYQEPGGQVVFETMTRVRSDLLDEKDRGRLRQRRIAYRVRVRPPPPGPPFAYEVETVLQFQLRVERAWRLDNDAERRERHARALADLLTGAVKPPPSGGREAG